MSVPDLEQGFALIEANPERAHFVGPIGEEMVRAAESTLELDMAISYREFLLRLGAGSFGAAEFYGILGSDLHAAGVPNAIWVTSRRRQETKTPVSFVVVGQTGYGSDYVIDTAQIDDNGESPVLEWWPGLPGAKGNPKKVYSDFGEMFLDLLNCNT